MRTKKEDEALYAVVCVYNQDIDDSITCINLKNIFVPKLSVIIVDNSTIASDNEKRCSDIGWTYISMNGNAGISKAYNRVLDFLKNKTGVVIWFDDDTNITPQYFDVLLSALETDAEIFVPVIMEQDGNIHSPNEARFIREKQLKNPYDKINLNKMNAINSCTAVRLSVYKAYRYDEKLFLDQVDHDFFRTQRIEKRRFYQLDVVIHHDFSVQGKMSLDAVKTRYGIMIPDLLTFYSKTYFRIYLGYIKVFGWALRLTKLHQVNMFPWCFKQIKLWQKRRQNNNG